MYRAFNFYDNRGRRLAVFGEHTITGKIRISIITCSKDDNFSKKKAVRLYESNVYPGSEPNNRCTISNILVPIEDPLKPGKSFHKFINMNFWRKQERLMKVRQDILIPPAGSFKKVRVLRTSKPIVKMDHI